MNPNFGVPSGKLTVFSWQNPTLVMEIYHLYMAMIPSMHRAIRQVLKLLHGKRNFELETIASIYAFINIQGWATR